MKQNSFRKQKVHTDLNKFLVLAKAECDEVMYFNLLEIREYINHLEAQNLGLRRTNENLMEKLEKRYIP